MGDDRSDYKHWSHERLLTRVTELEAQLKILQAGWPRTAGRRDAAEQDSTPKARKPVDQSRYNTRHIALKFAYLGQRYNGFEHHANNTTPLPTVEEVMYQALKKVMLIFPPDPESAEVDWSCCDYSKCGRTDRGVSAFGQVIGLRVRSNAPIEHKITVKSNDGSSSPLQEQASNPVVDELDYPRMLNRVLPEDIRVLAWAPVSSTFSARFSCGERQYRYFFTQPAFLPHPHQSNGRLDIEAMQRAAKYLEGLHDFRNFCKVDASKQLINFQRRIFRAEIVQVSDAAFLHFLEDPQFKVPAEYHGTGVYSFNVCGSAFLWHQVRHMVAVLFLVGQGLERPEVVQSLLQVDRIAGRPVYEMADDAPLVLWDCIFPEQRDAPGDDTIQWVYPQDDSTSQGSLWGPTGTNEALWTLWRGQKINETLSAGLLNLAIQNSVDVKDGGTSSAAVSLENSGPRIFRGGDGAKSKGRYQELLQRDRLEPPDVQNARYLVRKSNSRRLGLQVAEAAGQ